MSGPDFNFRTPSYATHLRQELSLRNFQYAQRANLPNFETQGQPSTICYLPTVDGRHHGNFLPETYRAICKDKNWSKRLEKAHTSARETLPRTGRRWCELDSSNSSDALLMNIFCFPRVATQPGIAHLLGTDSATPPEFGVKARVPLANKRADRTEVDMKLGDLLVEAKLTESDFQSAPATVVETYRDFHEVFDSEMLPRTNDRYASYQLIRNVLAAKANVCPFCVMIDARRPDLREAWYAVMRSVKIMDLRLRCKILTWQELAAHVPRKLQTFLEQKYGIMNAAA